MGTSEWTAMPIGKLLLVHNNHTNVVAHTVLQLGKGGGIASRDAWDNQVELNQLYALRKVSQFQNPNRGLMACQAVSGGTTITLGADKNNLSSNTVEWEPEFYFKFADIDYLNFFFRNAMIGDQHIVNLWLEAI